MENPKPRFEDKSVESLDSQLPVFEKEVAAPETVSSLVTAIKEKLQDVSTVEGDGSNEKIAKFEVVQNPDSPGNVTLTLAMNSADDDSVEIYLEEPAFDTATGRFTGDMVHATYGSEHTDTIEHPYRLVLDLDDGAADISKDDAEKLLAYIANAKRVESPL
ncbi:MAG TPA: hypothetical protein VF272_01675 [Candidatus Saccharimonadia bacterium]